MSRRPTTRAELQLLGATPEIQLMGATEVASLRSAMQALARKIPSADPGPAQPGDAGYVTNQMIGALASVASRVPKMPGEVKTALGLVSVGIPLLEQNATGRALVQGVRATISRLGGQIAGVVNGYVGYLATTGGGGAGGGATAYPPRSISTWDVGNAIWRVAAPKDAGLAGVLGCGEGSEPGLKCVDTVTYLGDYLGQMWPPDAGTYEEVGTAAGSQAQVPSGTTQVSNQDYKKATRSPFYKTWWFWTGAGVVVVGGGLTWWLLRSPRRRGRRR